MFQAMKDYWWLLLIRGVVAIVFGIYALINPGITALSLVFAFGAYAVVLGGIAIALALFGGGTSGDRVMLGIQGVLQALLGVLVFSWPDITMLSLLWAIILFAFVGGIVEIVAAFQYRDLWVGLSGVISILFSIYGFRFPSEGALAILFAIGIYAIGAGLMQIIASFQVRRVGSTLAPATA